MLEIDDNQLIKRVAQGDERAFLTLYDCYVGRVHALTLRILGNPMLTEEAMQDTFLKLCSRAREYQPERGLLLTWLLTIARRTALDRLRLEGRRPMLSDSNDPTETLHFSNWTQDAMYSDTWHPAFCVVYDEYATITSWVPFILLRLRSAILKICPRVPSGFWEK